MNQPATGIRRVVRDVADLCELQLELLAVDGKEATQRSAAAFGMVLVASVFGLSAVTVAVLALASALHENWEWTLSSSLLAAAGIAALGAIMFAILSFIFVKRAVSAFNETRSELAENMRWIKFAIVSSEYSGYENGKQKNFNSR
jgi:glucan phosphoethanolaminetransferase (alkaline phosphatase superfamily)